jgi:hypothetical protein
MCNVVNEAEGINRGRESTNSAFEHSSLVEWGIRKKKAFRWKWKALQRPNEHWGFTISGEHAAKSGIKGEGGGGEGKYGKLFFFSIFIELIYGPRVFNEMFRPPSGSRGTFYFSGLRD